MIVDVLTLAYIRLINSFKRDAFCVCARSKNALKTLFAEIVSQDELLKNLWS